jgi:hypothetical protein
LIGTGSSFSTLNGWPKKPSYNINWATFWSAAFWQGPFGRTLGWKLLFGAMILLASAYHGFFVGPHATIAWQADPTAPAAHRL